MFGGSLSRPSPASFQRVSQHEALDAAGSSGVGVDVDEQSLHDGVDFSISSGSSPRRAIYPSPALSSLIRKAALAAAAAAVAAAERERKRGSSSSSSSSSGIDVQAEWESAEYEAGLVQSESESEGHTAVCAGCCSRRLLRVVAVAVLVPINVVLLLCLFLFVARHGHLLLDTLVGAGSDSGSLLAASISEPAAFELAAAPSIPLSAPLPAVCLNQWVGRWGNHVYHSMYLLSFAARHQLHPFIPAWESNIMGMGTHFFSHCPEPVDDGSVVQVKVPEVWSWGSRFEQHPLHNLSLTGYEVTPSWAVNEPTAVARRGVAVLHGWFQFPHSGYRPYRALFAAHMKMGERRERALEEMWHRLLLSLDDDVLLVAVHIRQGDYSADMDTCYYCRVPISWYVRWLGELRHNHTLALSHADNAAEPRTGTQQQQQQQQQQQPSILQRALQAQREEALQALQSGAYGSADSLPRSPCNHSIAVDSGSNSSVRLCLLVLSDEIGPVSEQFRAANERVVTSRDVLRFLPTGWRLSDLVGEEVLDWWLLTRAPLVAVSHSSFSYSASLFSRYTDVEGEGRFWRPVPKLQAMGQFDPWNAHYIDGAFRDAREERERERRAAAAAAATQP